MLTQADQQLERYEARRKAQLDDQKRLRVARMEGREEGRTEGKKIGIIRTIHFCQRILDQTQSPSEQLAGLSLEELTCMADDLQAQVLKQR
jgi:hypothetical protein